MLGAKLKFRLSDKQKNVLIAVVASILVLYFKEALALTRAVISAVSPFCLGLLLALILRPSLCFFEDHIFQKVGFSKKASRISALATTYSLFSVVIFFSFYVLVPQIAVSITHFAEKLSEFAGGLSEFLRGAMEFFGASEETIKEIETLIYGSIQNIGEFIMANLPSVATFALNIWSKVSTFCFAVIFSIYILYDKEKLKNAFSMLTCKILKKDLAKKILKLEEEITDGFASFFSGQMVEAVILGGLCFCGMTLLSLPYAPLISTIMMITAVIPLIGAFLGTIPSTIIILLASPLQAVIFVVFILVLQTVEGNLIYPHVVGVKVKLPPLVILFAVLSGGSLFGVVGAVVAVPLFSVFYKYFKEYLASGD